MRSLFAATYVSGCRAGRFALILMGDCCRTAPAKKLTSSSQLRSKNIHPFHDGLKTIQQKQKRQGPACRKLLKTMVAGGRIELPTLGL
jgi:hypothetical protein